MAKDRPRKFKKYVALNRRGVPLWGTMANTATEAQEHHDRYNPDPTGQGHGETIVEATILLKT
jgi:hypothetical protein